MSRRWTEAQRQQLSERVRDWKPWEKSTGPRSVEGKKRAAMRALKTGEHAADIRATRKIIAAQNRLLREIGALV
jgi:hypothetical protein